MNHDEVFGLLAVHALGALRDQELAAVEAHLETCGTCRDELRTLAPVLRALQQPEGLIPDDLRAELVGAIQEAQQPMLAARSRQPRRRRQLAVAAAAAVLVVGIFSVVLRQQQRIDDLTVALRDSAVEGVETAAVAPGADRFELRSSDGEIELVAVVTRTGDGYLEASALPRLSADRTYQLWGIDGQRTVSLALLGADPDLVQFGAQVFSAFAITDEVVGGAAQPSLPPLVQGVRA